MTPTVASRSDLRFSPWLLQLLSVAALALFFFFSYNFANWATSLRHGVPSLLFGWERHIPFLAWTIVPYWSTDVLYALSLFLCRTRRQLSVHSKRLVAAQIISIVAFLLFPLRFTFERPHVTGFFGWLFDALDGFDKPFNQAPSLHLSVTVILWANFSRHLRGGMLWLMRAWMILVSISTLTTYQHHFIDVPTGIWVGLLCIVLFPDIPTAVRQPARTDALTIRLGAAYSVCSLFLIVLAFRIGGTAWWLLWPAGAPLLVAGIYFSRRPELFQKSHGSLALPVTILLAPYLAAAWLNSRLWTFNERKADEITDGVWLGRMPCWSERAEQSIASVVDLTAELSSSTAGIVYRCVPMLDLVAPSVEELDAAVQAIEELGSKRPTLVCCALGYSRSAAAIAAWLISSGRSSSVGDSIALIGTRRGVVLTAAHRARLHEWYEVRRGV